ncbi:hypothetical protein J2S40_001851 [Nocardioides luteus]|uniref:DUF4235 domain-containing protein n=1 Tax=Nocardioides luteus TaxID=1844 RepID=A0ABQ5SZ13_9ACTN|nr:DUF4235 domain-containing protein [Nocardioides luteus]MDR7310793.1 hypothetical protein [Nocardioides luteus]GGR40604.1 hypothetical protein GCM10010197_02030 [Nocardioides luteus]GLJ69427.1 hypothetical protein GCM10017579_34630 [Nocardioides luteus]
MSKSTQSDKGDKLWAIMAVVSGLGAAKVTNKLLSTGWKASTGRKPPANPADPDVSIGEAVAWSIATGALVALARMFVQRRAADYFVKSVGRLPKQLEKDA